jgi:tRNA wybutosine-synthesizing protein 3
MVKGEVIVDLYCGVGYYTIPFLLHGKASHVHACEWNPNSLLAIRENLRKAGSDVTSRCTVYAGDNNESALLLPSIADRVCLGLLPSSVGGWPLAVIVLKPTGGIMHVHENVRDTEVECWTASTCAYFEEKFAAAGKPCIVSCRHTERVKSYAPHILHIVVDLVCTPT